MLSLTLPPMLPTQGGQGWGSVYDQKEPALSAWLPGLSYTRSAAHLLL